MPIGNRPRRLVILIRFAWKSYDNVGRYGDSGTCLPKLLDKAQVNLAMCIPSASS